MNTLKKINLLFSLVIFSLFYSLSTSPAHAANPRLYFSPVSATYYQGNTFSVDVNLDSAGINHKETNVEIHFDPALLQVVNVTNFVNYEGGLYYNFPVNQIDNINGRLLFKGDYQGNFQTSSGRLFKINFKAIATTSSPYMLSFHDNSYVMTYEDTNVSPLDKGNTTFIFNTPAPDSLLTINSLYNSWSKNDTQEISIDLDTQGNDIAGVDVIFNYNKSLFEYQNFTWSGLLPNQQGYSVDTDNGRITFSGVANQGLPINTKGNIIKLTFKALTNTGSGDFSFDWTPGSTIDTNIVSYSSQNTDLLTTAPITKSISVIDSATLDFGFNLLNFLGVNKTRNGSITVSGPNVVSNFMATVNSGIASITGHSLGTFTYGQAYDLIISVPGYLKNKINMTINTGANTAEFGNLRPGDINSDGVVNSSDLQYLYWAWNGTGYPIEDLNADGKVNTFDVGILYGQFNGVDYIILPLNMGHLVLKLIFYLLLSSLILFNPKSSFAATIKLVLPPSVKSNQEFNVEVYLDTKSEKTIGTDLLINYNPKNYTFIKALPGKLYPVYHPVKVYSEKNNIRYSGTNNYNSYKNANGLFATFVFSSKISAKPGINLQWEKNKTNDTNVIGVKGDDLLITSPNISYLKKIDNKPTEKIKPTNEPTDSPQSGEILGETDNSSIYQETPLSVSNLTNTNYPKVAGTNTIRRLAVFIIILVLICLGSLGFILFLMSKKRKERETKE